MICVHSSVLFDIFLLAVYPFPENKNFQILILYTRFQFPPLSKEAGFSGNNTNFSMLLCIFIRYLPVRFLAAFIAWDIITGTSERIGRKSRLASNWPWSKYLARSRDLHPWKIWQDQYRPSFIPERFSESHIDLRGQDLKLTPLGSSSRSCPDLQLGLILVRFTLAKLSHCFCWGIADNKGGYVDIWNTAEAQVFLMCYEEIGLNLEVMAIRVLKVCDFFDVNFLT